MASLDLPNLLLIQIELLPFCSAELAMDPRAGQVPDRRIGWRNNPEPCSFVKRRGHDASPVAAERGAADRVLMAGEEMQLFAGLRIPEPCGLIIRRGHDVSPVAAERGTEDPALMSG